MGNYAECWLGKFHIGSIEDNIDPAIIELFRSSDKHIFSGTKKDFPAQLRYWAECVQWAEGTDDEEIVDFIYYSVPIIVIRDRLNLIGYTLDTSKIAFTKWVNQKIDDYEKLSQTYPGAVLEDLNLIKEMDGDGWLLALKQICGENLKPRQLNHPKDEYDATLIGYMLNKTKDWYGYPGLDLSVALRLALEIFPDTDEFICDVTDLILCGYHSKDDDLVELYSSRSKIIVLTEGSTDSWIITESLRFLYPHLADYFTFMDFEGARVGGGAGSLANIIKAFSGTGIVNKVVALFDNDTAAASALRGLRLVQIPLNIKVIQLPEIELLKDYPTIGPSGLATMDINGLAASIELYLGEDVLVDAKGNLSPVQWTGFISEVGRYQGEVLSKEEIQRKFKQKVSDCKANNELLQTTDWAGLRAILQSLFTVFNDFDREEILSFVDAAYY